MKNSHHGNSRRAFTLLEVMIAIGIFFLGAFTILSLISQSLSNAQRLKHPLVDASAIVAQLSLTNELTEGPISGNLGDVLGKTLADYQAQADKPFDHEARLKELLVRQAQLDAALDLDKNEMQIAQRAEDDIGFAGASLPQPPPLQKSAPPTMRL